jgi:hypothetical protein
MNFGLSFTNPWALLLWPPLALYFVWLARRSLADLSPFRRRVATGLRLTVLTLLVLALAGLQFVRFNRDLAIMFVVDYSDSVGPKSKETAETYIQNAIKDRKPGDRWGVVVFGREAFIDLAPGTAPTLGKIQTVPPTEFTDISAAIRLGMASLPMARKSAWSCYPMVTKTWAMHWLKRRWRKTTKWRSMWCRCRRRRRMKYFWKSSRCLTKRRLASRLKSRRWRGPRRIPRRKSSCFATANMSVRAQ